MRGMTYSDVKKFLPRLPRRRSLLVGLAVLVSAVLLLLWQLEQEILVQIIIPVSLGGLGLYFVRRQTMATEESTRATEKSTSVAQNNVRVAQEGYLTEGFARAIEQLGDTEMAIRLGGIYALEQIAKDSEKDHGRIMEVLTAYVREKAPRQEEDPQPAPAPLPTDMQAILTVLGRRETTGKNRGTDRLDLSHTRLTRANLSGAELGGANLYEADLRGVDLRAANLSEADLTRAILGGVPLPPEAPQDDAFLLSPTNLDGVWPPQPVNPSAVNLRGAELSRANLGGATLTWADLSDANLSGASLRAATLTWAILSDATLTKADLIAARLGGAWLDEADLRGAELALAILYEAGAGFAMLPVAMPPMGANLTRAKNLTAKQVKLAQNWWHAHLPDDLQYLLKDPPPPPA